MEFVKHQNSLFLKVQKRPDSALKYADSLIKVVTNKPDLLNQYISALFVRGDVLMESGLYDDAYVRAGKIAKSSSKCYLLSSKLAMLRYRQGSYRQSIPYFKKGFQEILVCIDTTRFEQAFVLPQSLLNTLGLCFEKLNQPDSAIFYYQKAIRFIEEREKCFPSESSLH